MCVFFVSYISMINKFIREYSINAGLIMSRQAEKEAAELRRAIKALEAHVEAKACFMDAFDQLQNLPLVDGKPVIRYLVSASIHSMIF